MRIYLVFLLILFLINETYSQGLPLTIKVVENGNDQPIFNVNITVLTQSGIVYRTTSDSVGNFKIPQTNLFQFKYIRLSALNYDEYVIKKDEWIYLTKILRWKIIRLNPHTINLNEVSIKSSKRYRDTTKINLSTQHFERSVMIDDIISSSMGFSKGQNGQLFYKGKVVSDLKVNGLDFFGKNNFDILKLLPALVLKDLQIIESNIDDVTNTTTTNPSIKLNLNFKDQYNKGLLGHANIAGGTLDRFLANADIYTYKNKEQFSFSGNANNIAIGDDMLLDPSVSFSANGNDINSKNLKLSYSNACSPKFDVDISFKGKIENKIFTSETDRQEKLTNQFAKIITANITNQMSIPTSEIKLRYKIDSLNMISASLSLNYDKIKQQDSSIYYIDYNGQITSTEFKKSLSTVLNTFVTQLLYEKKFSSKKGRFLSVSIKKTINNISNNELDNLQSDSSNNLRHSYIHADRKLNGQIFSINPVFTEPISNSSYINITALYNNEYTLYNPSLINNNVTNITPPVRIYNQFIQSGFNYQKTFKKALFIWSVADLVDINRIAQINNNSLNRDFFNYNINFLLDYKIKENKKIAINVKEDTKYPTISQLTNIDNTYDLVSQTYSNYLLKPEVKNILSITYDTRKPNIRLMTFNAGLEMDRSVFGYNITALPNSTQSSIVENIGNAFSSHLGFSILNSSPNRFFINYSNSLTYQELPTFFNDKLLLNRGYSFNQSISTSQTVIKDIVTISPLLTSSYGEFFYGTIKSNNLSFSYSDKYTFSMLNFKLELFPLINYSYNITHVTSFSLNGKIYKDILKKYGIIWIQAYDIFNSFKFINNYQGSSYIQSVRYSTINRYILFGFSLKFNNIK